MEALKAGGGVGGGGISESDCGSEYSQASDVGSDAGSVCGEEDRMGPGGVVHVKCVYHEDVRFGIFGFLDFWIFGFLDFFFFFLNFFRFCCCCCCLFVCLFVCLFWGKNIYLFLFFFFHSTENSPSVLVTPLKTLSN